MHDYGAQTGFRLLTRGAVEPAALIIQNSEAYYAEGRTDAWDTAEAYWRDPSTANREKIRASVLNPEGIRREFMEGQSADVEERIDPAIIRLACDHVERPGVADAVLDLHRDYQSNVEHFPAVQAYLRDHRPATMVLWGRGDQYYRSAQTEAFNKDLPDVSVELLDGGHWILESHPVEVSSLTRNFLQSGLIARVSAAHS